MFQFRRFPPYCYFIHSTVTELHSAGFPHSEIHGSKTAFVLPWLIADRCVLRRLLVPRHSPCALCSLTIARISSSSTRRKIIVLPLILPCFALLFDILLFVQFSRYIHQVIPSYISVFRNLVGSSGLEPPTSRLSGARSNQLSYEPI